MEVRILLLLLLLLSAAPSPLLSSTRPGAPSQLSASLLLRPSSSSSSTTTRRKPSFSTRETGRRRSSDRLRKGIVTRAFPLSSSSSSQRTAWKSSSPSSSLSSSSSSLPLPPVSPSHPYSHELRRLTVSRRQAALRTRAAPLASAAAGLASNSAGWLLISLAVACHEGGHFYAALWQRMLIQEYAIGFGPRVLSRTGARTNITYSLRALPLGGFVSFPSSRSNAGEEEGQEKDGKSGDGDDADVQQENAVRVDPEDPNLLENRPVPQQVLVALGGILANMVVAYAACVGAVLGGLPDPVLGQGVKIESVDARGPAQLAGLAEGDVITSVNGNGIAGGDLKSFVDGIATNPDKEVRLDVQKADAGGADVQVRVTPNGEGRISVKVQPNVLEMRKKEAENAADAVLLANTQFTKIIREIVDGYLGLLHGAKAELAGPLSMAQMGGKTVSTGDPSDTFLFFAALNLNLAAANAVPIPGLDGARVASLLLLSLLGRKELSAKEQQAVDVATEVSGFLLVILVFNVLLSDIGRVLPFH